MAIKLADTLAPMADFPAAMAENIAFDDGKSLQEKYDNGEFITEEQLLAKDYANKTYVMEEVAKVSTGGEIDLSSYLSKIEASETYVTNDSATKQVADSLASANNYTNQKFSEIEYPVTSVNGQTGDIEISASSIGAVDNEEFSTTNAKVLSMETTIGTLQTQVENNTDNLTDVINLADANSEGIATLSGQISGISESTNTANANAAEALTKAQSAENTVSIQQSSVTNLSNQVGDMAATVEGHTTSINTLQASVGSKANANDVYTKTQVDNKVSSSVTSVYKYKGNVATLSGLNDIASPENGHVYFVAEDSLNYAYTDGSWNPLAGIIDLSDYVTDSDMTTALAGKANTTDVKTKTSQLENDSEFVTQTDVEAMLSSAGVGAVQTVNGKYGNVELNAADVGAVTASEVTTTVNTALENYYTKNEVDGLLGDIETILNEINGEIV
jgi:hypothetical protein